MKEKSFLEELRAVSTSISSITVYWDDAIDVHFSRNRCYDDVVDLMVSKGYKMLHADSKTKTLYFESCK